MSGQHWQLRGAVCDTTWLEGQYGGATMMPGYIDVMEIQSALCNQKPEIWLDRLMNTSLSMKDINELSKKVGNFVL